MRRDEATPRGGADTDGEDNDELRGTADTDATLRRIGTALQGLRYGSVLVIIQDGVVVQIERTEKTRVRR